MDAFRLGKHQVYFFHTVS